MYFLLFIANIINKNANLPYRFNTVFIIMKYLRNIELGKETAKKH